MKSFPISTKNYDGGSSEEANQPNRRSVFIEGYPDAFTKYSNNEVRMDRLLYRRASAPPIPSSNIVESDSNNMDTSTTTKNTHAASLISSRSRQPPRRLTRLSFEVHPSLILDPILLSAFDEMASTPTSIIVDDEKKTDEYESTLFVLLMLF
jgi:hypothetical protein